MGGRGSGGHNRKSTAVKKAEGNRGKRKLNKSEPAPLPGEPPIPGWLKPESRIHWPEICKVLQENGTLFKTDAVAIAALCNSLALFIKANANIKKFGIVIVQDLDEETGTGTIRANPAVRIRSDALRQLRQAWQSFGLDPAARSAIRLDPTDPGKKKPTEENFNDLLGDESDSDVVM
jgi:P27 family predicted phage terminase small subunit